MPPGTQGLGNGQRAESKDGRGERRWRHGGECSWRGREGQAGCLKSHPRWCCGHLTPRSPEQRGPHIPRPGGGGWENRKEELPPGLHAAPQLHALFTETPPGSPALAPSCRVPKSWLLEPGYPPSPDPLPTPWHAPQAWGVDPAPMTRPGTTPPLGYPTCQAFVSSPLPKPALQGPLCVCARRFPLGRPGWHTLSSARPEEPGEDTTFLESRAWRGPGHPYLLQGQAQDPSLDPAPLSGGHTPPAAPPTASHLQLEELGQCAAGESG